MFKNLDASNFNYNSAFYQNEFEKVLLGVIMCYNCINFSEVSLPNDENKIRDIMLNKYLKVESFKRAHSNLANYHFDYETVENRGRADIRILPINPYLGDKAYYIIECKRLDNKNTKGISGLNAEYVKNGVCRFVTDYYSSYFNINGMIGFVVEGVNIDENRHHINSFFDKNLINDKKEQVNAITIQKMEQIVINPDFKYSYTSKHRLADQNEVVLYHLIFDFSKNIQ